MEEYNYKTEMVDKIIQIYLLDWVKLHMAGFKDVNLNNFFQ